MSYITRHIASLLIALLCVVPGIVVADNAGLVNGIWFSEEEIFAGESVRIFSVVQNETDDVLNDSVAFLVDGVSVGSIQVSVASGAIYRVEIKHTFTEGEHTVTTQFAGAPGELSRSVSVDADTDGDGIGNKEDDDDDNDGILDVDDAEPLVKNEPPSEGSVTDFVNPTKLASSTEAVLDTLFGASTDQEATSTGARVAQTARGAAGGAIGALQALEGARERGAANVKKYEEEQRQKIDTIERAAAEGFQPTPGEDIPSAEDETGAHIAAAGAAVLGSVLEHELMFYAHIILLLFSVWHVIWGYLKKKYRAQY